MELPDICHTPTQPSPYTKMPTFFQTEKNASGVTVCGAQTLASGDSPIES